MSSAGSVQVQITQITVFDSLGLNGYNMLVTGGVYHVTPQVANDGEASSLNINELGELRITGSVPDNVVLPASSDPVWIGGIYRAALPTYDNGDSAAQHMDVNGRALVREDTLTRATGTRDADTLRVTIATDDFALGDGNTAANSLRVTLANDDFQQGAGVVSASTWRVTIGTDDAIHTSLGNINTSLSNLIDTNNSTVAPLGIGASFAPANGTDVSGYAAVTIQVFADQDSAADGMRFEFSSDDVNWDDSTPFNLDTATSNTRRFQFPVTARYFRVNYTNGGVAQGAFRVQTILHRDSVLTSIHRVDGALTNDRSVTVVKSVLAGESTGGGGGFVNVRVTPSGALLGEFSEVASGAQTVKQAQITVGLAAVRLTTDAAAPDADRARLDVRPDANSLARFWYGGSGVTAANGTEIFPGELVPFGKDANDYYIISDTAAQTVGVVEVE